MTTVIQIPSKTVKQFPSEISKRKCKRTDFDNVLLNYSGLQNQFGIARMKESMYRLVEHELPDI